MIRFGPVFVLFLIVALVTGCDKPSEGVRVTRQATESATQVAEAVVNAGGTVEEAAREGTMAGLATPGAADLSSEDRRLIGQIAAHAASERAALREQEAKTARMWWWLIGSVVVIVSLLWFVFSLVDRHRVIEKSVMEANLDAAAKKELAETSQREADRLKQELEDLAVVPVQIEPTPQEVADKERAGQVRRWWFDAIRFSDSAKKAGSASEVEEEYRKKSDAISQLFALHAVRLGRDDGDCNHAPEGQLRVELDTAPWETAQASSWPKEFSHPLMKWDIKAERPTSIRDKSRPDKLHLRSVSELTGPGRRVAEAMLRQRLSDSMSGGEVLNSAANR